MKKLIPYVYIILLAWLHLNVLAVTYKTYSVSSTYPCLFDGAGRDWNGNIYIGAGDHDNYNAALLRFNFVSDRFDVLGDVKSASQTSNNWKSNDLAGKVHTSIKQGMDGRMYFGSHRTEDDFAYNTSFRGGHFYAYDPKTDILSDISAPGIGTPNQGLLDIALGLQHNVIYGVDESSKLYRQDLVTKQTKFIFDSNSDTRCIFSDNRGRLFSPSNYGRFLIYDPLKDSLSISRIYSTEFAATCKRIPALVKSMSGDSIYFIGISQGGDTPVHMWRYIVSLDQAEDLGLIDPADPFGNAYSLALRWDLNTLYYVKRTKFFSLHVITKVRKQLLTIPDPGRDISGSDGVDRNGNLWFTRKGSSSNRVYHFKLDIPCPVCTTKFAMYESTAVDRPLAAGAKQNSLQLSVSPNPAAAFASFSIGVNRNGGEAVFCVLDIRGRTVFRQQWDSMRPPAAVHWTGRVPAGLYVARLRQGSKTASKTFVLTR